jgi:curved DNA-binding protein CbpA
MDVTGYYRLFKIEDIAKVTEIGLKRKYRSLVLKFHPDHGGSADQFRYILDAYAYLVHERQRASKKSHGIRYTVTQDKKFYHYGDGSIFDIEKNRWKQYFRYGMWYIWDYKYIQHIK